MAPNLILAYNLSVNGRSYMILHVLAALIAIATLATKTIVIR
jgi:hypothetical protein